MDEEYQEEERQEDRVMAYEDLLVEEADRDVGEVSSGKSLSLTEAEEASQGKTDIQAILRTLTPRFATKRLNDLLQPVMVMRVFPDNHIDLNYLLNVIQFEEHEPDADIDFLGILLANQVATSIGFEGRGIADRLEMAGVIHEEELSKITKELGF